MTELSPKTRDVHLCLLKVHGFLSAQEQDATPHTKEALAMFLGLNVGLVVGMRDIHTARLVLTAIKGTDEGLVQNVVDELMRIVEREEHGSDS